MIFEIGRLKNFQNFPVWKFKKQNFFQFGKPNFDSKNWQILELFVDI